MLSAKYGLSQRYANHSIRVTSLQVLEDHNIEGRHIIRISGHKSTASVQSYARRLSASRKRNISTCFSNHLSSETLQSTPKRMHVVSDKNKANICVDSNAHTKNDNISINKLSVTMPPVISSNFSNLNRSSGEGNNSSGNLVDFNVGNTVDDVSLSRLPAELLHSFNSFNNCNNCSFVFHVHMHQK